MNNEMLYDYEKMTRKYNVIMEDEQFDSKRQNWEDKMWRSYIRTLEQSKREYDLKDFVCDYCDDEIEIYSAQYVKRINRYEFMWN